MNFTQLKSEIDRQAFCEVELQIPRETIEQAVHDFFTFLSLPEDVKHNFIFDIKMDERDRGMDLGYRKRSSSSGFGYDDKEFFHYNHYARDKFQPLLTDSPIAEAFFKSADLVYCAALEAMRKVIAILDSEYSGLYNRFFPTSIYPTDTLRFLKYDRAQPGDFLAKGHYDRGACALAIAESAPGLRIGSNDRNLIAVTHHPGHAFFFPGLTLSGYTNGDFRPSWHDVLQKGSNSFREDVARWAVVFFVNPPDPVYFNRDVVHTPISGVVS